MLSMVYVSSATHALDESKLADLLRVAQENNRRIDVTGLLLYKGGNFMQVLEGADQAVLDVYDKISRDPRHHGALPLLREQITERRFPNWSMSLKNVDHISTEDRIKLSPFLSDDFVAAGYRLNPTNAIKLLLSFRESMR
jgi:hypothetical protein